MAGPDARLQQQLEVLFLEELHDNLEVLSAGLATLEQVPSPAEQPVLQDLFRAAHSLKGAAHSAGVSAAVAPCHRLEEQLAEVRDGGRKIDEALIEQLSTDLVELRSLEHALAAAAAAPDGDGPPAPDDAGPPEPPRAGPARSADPRTRVAVARLDRLVERAAVLVSGTHELESLVGDIAAAREEASQLARRWRGAADGRNDAASLLAGIGGLTTRAAELERQLRHIAHEVAETAQGLRLQAFRDVVAGLEHTVHELCRSTGKDVRLVLEGVDVELDREVGEALREPLLHLVRNAVDHGIEPPDRRVAMGKPARGIVRIAASAAGADVVVAVSDDGAGLDLVALREAAGAHRADGSAVDDTELAFQPGISTASTLTDVSGRGVGLDAARARIESLGGTIRLRSTPSAGTAVEISVPRTLAVLHVVVVELGDGQFIALPMSSIARLHRFGDDDLEHLEGRSHVVVAGGRRPAADLAGAIGLSPQARVTGGGVAIEVSGEEGVLLAMRAVTELDVVLRAIPSPLSTGAGLLGATLLPEGRPALVVNPVAALREGLSMPAAPPPARTPGRRQRVLLVEDTLTTRALERSILEGAGYDVVVAGDGVEAMARLRHERAIDVVVSDVDMPRMSGIELCRAIRGSVQHGDVPVILVTSLASEEDRLRGLEAGANAYLVKSAFQQAALLDAVGRFT